MTARTERHFRKLPAEAERESHQGMPKEAQYDQC
jgi:hypothetical protein